MIPENTNFATRIVFCVRLADGVTQLVAYNSEGEAYRQAIDLNQNGQINSNDRITDSLQDVVASSPIGAALRSTRVLHDLNNNPVPLSTTYRSPDGLTTRQESLGIANPSTSVNASHLDRADGSWTETITNPDGTRQVTEYSNWLAVSTSSLSTDHSALITSSTSYDALRRSVSQAHSRTGLVTTNYATNGQVSSIDDHGRITSFGYDSMGRRTSTTLPDNSVTQTSYWPTGQEKATWGSQTNPAVKLYTAEGQLHKLRTFRSANLALAPDETTANYDETTWTYNSRNQLTRKEYADTKGTDYTYTHGGRLHTRTWARGVVTTYSYNAAGDLVTTTYTNDPADTPDVTITHDKLGRQQSITNGVATSVFAYDPATLALDTETITYNLPGQPTFTRVLDRSRDSLGRDTGYTLGSPSPSLAIETQATYTYEATTGRLGTVSGGALHAPNPFTYSYVPNSSLIATVTGPVHTVTNTWEPDRNVLDLKENKVGNTLVSSYDYTVNALGQRTNVATSGSAFPATPSWAWGYDSLGQVISADHSTDNNSDRAYQYDAIGNRKKSADSLTLPTDDNYTSNALNQVSSLSLNSQPSTLNDYDDDGNLTSGQLPTGSAGLVWDAENRLIAVNVIGQETIHYAYDSQSRRISRSVGSLPAEVGNEGWVSPTATNTIYIYDAWNVIAEYSIQNSTFFLKNTCLWGVDLGGSMQGAGGVGGLLSVSFVSETFFPTFDGNGNVSEYLDASGQIEAHFEYDPFGNAVVNTDGSGQFSCRFSTKPLDFINGLYYYGYRFYDPLNGSWPSRDPISERGGLNLYSFAEGNPLSNVDLFGLEKWPSDGGEIEVVIGGNVRTSFTPESVDYRSSVTQNGNSILYELEAFAVSSWAKFGNAERKNSRITRMQDGKSCLCEEWKEDLHARDWAYRHDSSSFTISADADMSVTQWLLSALSLAPKPYPLSAGATILGTQMPADVKLKIKEVYNRGIWVLLASQYEWRPISGSHSYTIGECPDGAPKEGQGENSAKPMGWFEFNGGAPSKFHGKGSKVEYNTTKELEQILKDLNIPLN